jgi:hypothetical protein
MHTSMVNLFMGREVFVRTRGGSGLRGTITKHAYVDDYIVVTSPTFEAGHHIETTLQISDIEWISEDK